MSLAPQHQLLVLQRAQIELQALPLVQQQLAPQQVQVQLHWLPTPTPPNLV
jgi:hypothetical protein